MAAEDSGQPSNKIKSCCEDIFYLDVNKAFDDLVPCNFQQHCIVVSVEYFVVTSSIPEQKTMRSFSKRMR